MNPTDLRGLVFQWAIKFPDGQYFLGCEYIRDGDGERTSKKVYRRANRGPITQAQTYAMCRAEVLIIQHPEAFAGCVAERIHA